MKMKISRGFASAFGLAYFIPSSGFISMKRKNQMCDLLPYMVLQNLLPNFKIRAEIRQSEHDLEETTHTRDRVSILIDFNQTEAGFLL